MAVVSWNFSGKSLSIETGTLAKQASGSAVVRFGDTIVLATATVSPGPREGVDFFPLVVDFEEKMYAAGKIPGSRFIKREGRPSDNAIATCRRIDRPLRPLFPRSFRNEVQVIITVLSADPWNPPDVPGLVGASAAVALSAVPFNGPLGAVRVGRVNGEFIVNPTHQDLETSDLDIVVAGTREGVLMVEAAASEVPEPVMAQAIEFGQAYLLPLIEIQEKLAEEAGKPKMEVPEKPADPEIKSAVDAFAGQIEEVLTSPDKLARESATSEIAQGIVQQLLPQFPEREAELKSAVEALIESVFRSLVLDQGRRVDGRAVDELRPLDCHVALLPQTHGSALFSRGQTQVLSIVTLGGMGEAQIVNTLTPEEETKRFMHHYYFPPFSVGEVRPMRGPSRRDIGHGTLVENSLLPLIPDENSFPYTIRVVSEVLESNGSSSMASVCASSLSLMDAGVPMKAGAAGVSIGMVTDGQRRVLLTDIQGIEDFSGNMDAKVAGTRNGVTGIQLDVKCAGVPLEVISQALERARDARMRILDAMDATLSAPRPELAPHAPRVFALEIHPDKIGDLIGPGGKVVKKIEADFGVRVDIEQDGRVFVAATDKANGEAAVKTIESITREVRVGETYVGKVVRITTFGAFVEIAPGKDGLLHISEIAPHHLKRVEDVLRVGDEVMVKVIQIDPAGKVRLSRKSLLEQGSAGEQEERRG